MHLDAPNGELLGIVSCKSGAAWTEKKCKVKKRDGIHDLYFVFGGSDTSVMHFDSWQFCK